MHKLRVFVALLFGTLIVVGLMVRYRQHPDRQVVVDPFQPVWNKLLVLAERAWRKTSEVLSVDEGSAWTSKPLQGSWLPSVFAKLHPDFVTGTILISELRDIMKSSKTFGDANSSLVLLQWCDFWSTYCIESYEQWVIFAYINAFPKQLSYQLKGFPRDTKTDTLLQHKATMCVESLASDELFLSFYFNIYQARGGFTEQELELLAEKMKIEGFAECLATKNIFPLQQEMKNGRKIFGFQSLPAYVLVDKNTGEYVLIPGLYETQEVLQAIQWLLDQQ